MKIIKFALLFVILAILAGLAYFAFADIPVQQQTVTKKIETDTFLKP